MADYQQSLLESAELLEDMAGKLRPSQMVAFVLSLSATVSNECNVGQKKVLKDLDKLTKEREVQRG